MKAKWLVVALVVCISFNSLAEARYYDSGTGRFISADSIVPDPSNPQALNRYAYADNNPVLYVDPSGHVWFVPLLVAAAIGAGTSAAVYSATALATGSSWNLRQFSEAAAAGAIAGAVSAGIAGSLTGAFGQNVAFNVLGQMGGFSAATIAQGGELNGATLAGGLAGALVTSGMPGFQGVNGGSAANVGAELGYGAIRGAVGGAVGGGVSAALTPGASISRGIGQGAQAGAISGGTVAGLQIAAFGPAFRPGASAQQKLANMSSGEGTSFGQYGPVYRTGGLSRFFNPGAEGLTAGRNLMIFDGTDSTIIHETAHYNQAAQIGTYNMHVQGVAENANYGSTQRYFTPGTLEYNARQLQLKYE